MPPWWLLENALARNTSLGDHESGTVLIFSQLGPWGRFLSATPGLSKETSSCVTSSRKPLGWCLSATRSMALTKCYIEIFESFSLDCLLLHISPLRWSLVSSFFCENCFSPPPIFFLLVEKHCRIVIKLMGFGAGKSEAQILYRLLVLTSDLTSLNFSFIICKKGMKIIIKCSYILLHK